MNGPGYTPGATPEHTLTRDDALTVVAGGGRPTVFCHGKVRAARVRHNTETGAVRYVCAGCGTHLLYL